MPRYSLTWQRNSRSDSATCRLPCGRSADFCGSPWVGGSWRRSVPASTGRPPPQSAPASAWSVRFTWVPDMGRLALNVFRMGLLGARRGSGAQPSAKHGPGRIRSRLRRGGPGGAAAAQPTGGHHPRPGNSPCPDLAGQPLPHPPVRNASSDQLLRPGRQGRGQCGGAVGAEDRVRGKRRRHALGSRPRV